MKLAAFVTTIVLASWRLGFTAGESRKLAERRRAHQVGVRQNPTKPRTQTNNVHVRGSNVHPRDEMNFIQTEPCVLLHEEIEFSNGSDEELWACRVFGEDAELAGADPGYPTRVKIEGVDLLSIKPDIVSGITTLLVEGEATLDGNRLILSEDNTLLFGEVPHRRRLANKMGELNTLIVRVTSTDSEVTLSASELSDSVFGSSSDVVNLKSVSAGCSWGQVDIVKAQGAGIVDGVYEYELNRATNGADTSNIEDRILVDLENELGYTRDTVPYDLMMVVLPPGINSDGSDSWSAYATMDGFDSFYNNEVVSYPSYQMHEVGHNWNLAHASQEDEVCDDVDDEECMEYGDQSGQMGYGAWENEQIEGLKFCFNGAHSYELGWYEDYNVDLNPLREQFDGLLAGVGKGRPSGTSPDDEKIVVKLADDDFGYYIMFNHKIGANAGTTEAANQVTVVWKDDAPAEKTWLVSKLSSGQKHTIENFNNSGQTVTIEVVSIDKSSTGFAHVRIYTGEFTGSTTLSTDSPVDSCTDSDRWEVVDEYDNSTYGCEWFKENDPDCSEYQSESGWIEVTAGDACCRCEEVARAECVDWEGFADIDDDDCSWYDDNVEQGCPGGDADYPGFVPVPITEACCHCG